MGARAGTAGTGALEPGAARGLSPIGAWPDGARSAVCLSFDNLGVDEASSAAAALPPLLEQLAAHDLRATFFCEGINAELNPETLREIAAAGHEVAYHALRHEEWSELSAAEQAANLARGIDAFGELGIDLTGFRPPGGQLGEGGVDVLRESGLHYASPAGEGAGVDADIALLPFAWRHVDATSLLPGLDPVRKQMTGSPDPIDPDAFASYLLGEVNRLAREGGFISIVLHLPLLQWLGESTLDSILHHLSTTSSWVSPCDEIATHIRANPTLFANRTTLDPTSWTP